MKQLTNKEALDINLELDLTTPGSDGSSYGRDNLVKNPPNIHVFIIGCGGNGGHVIPQIFRYNRSFIDRQNIPVPAGQVKPPKFNIQLTIADGDIVEPKNLVRQNFIAPDIGKNKARVLGERYGKAFGIEVGIIERYLNADIVDELISTCQGSVVVLSCVDNNATRAIIHKNLVETQEEAKAMRMRHLFWIDVANEKYDGQAVIGYRGSAHVNGLKYGGSPRIRLQEYWDSLLIKVKNLHNGLPLIRKGMYFPMPFFTELFPGVLKEKPDFDPDDPSCAEHAQASDQAMATNIMSASQLFSAYCQVMAALTDHKNKDDQERRPRAHLINFGHGGRASAKFNTLNNLVPVFMSHTPSYAIDEEELPELDDDMS
jgi:hypothetical protein